MISLAGLGPDDKPCRVKPLNEKFARFERFLKD